MADIYLYLPDGNRIFRNGREGRLKAVPDTPTPTRCVSWGVRRENYYLDEDGVRHDLVGLNLIFYTDPILRLIDNATFELGELREELSNMRTKIECTDYVERGIAAGTLQRGDYAGILRDRIAWTDRCDAIEKRIKEIETA